MASRAQRVTYSALFAVLMILGAYARIPFAQVPATLQTFFVYLAGLIFDPWTAAGSQALYILLGVVGLPVFASGQAGPQALLGPTGGFLISFPLAALAESLVAGRGSGLRDALALAVGFFVVFGLGTLYFSAYFDTKGPADALLLFLPFMAWDVVKAGLAYVVGRQLRVALRGQLTSGRQLQG
jgi:biotin transport system substrate-specific component